MGYNNLGNFHIIKKIGRGQFSEVYRAAYILDHTPVALKKVQVRTVFICEIIFFFLQYLCKYMFSVCFVSKIWCKHFVT